MVDFVVAIPARMASTRLLGKPLLDIAGKPMVLHVVDRALAAGAREVVVATDDARIFDVVREQGVKVCMTRADHPSGTDRLAETAAQCDWSADQIVINLQGDEPLAPPAALNAVAQMLAHSSAPVATMATPIQHLEQFLDPNCVKVVMAQDQRAMYFSRAPIPWPRDAFAQTREQWPDGFSAWRHIGLYGYRAGFLHRYAALPKAGIETVEALEQLRILHAGFEIKVATWQQDFPAGVDTEADLNQVRSQFNAANETAP